MAPSRSETVGVVMMGVGVPGAIMSMFLPSPSTAYDKASGQISSGPQSLALLRRGEIMGTIVSLSIALAGTLLAADDLGANAAWIFVGALAVISLFIYEYESAFRKGKADAGAPS